MALRGLTVRQPWAWAIAEGHKRVENRVRAPPAAFIGRDIAIHAGLAQRDDDDDGFIESLGIVTPEELDIGVIIAVAHLHMAMPPERARAVLSLADIPWHQEDRFAWLLGNVRKLPEPVECKGQLGLWTVPAHIEEKVLAQLP